MILDYWLVPQSSKPPLLAVGVVLAVQAMTPTTVDMTSGRMRVKSA